MNLIGKVLIKLGCLAALAATVGGIGYVYREDIDEKLHPEKPLVAVSRTDYEDYFYLTVFAEARKEHQNISKLDIKVGEVPYYEKQINKHAGAFRFIVSKYGEELQHPWPASLIYNTYKISVTDDMGNKTTKTFRQDKGTVFEETRELMEHNQWLKEARRNKR